MSELWAAVSKHFEKHSPALNETAVPEVHATTHFICRDARLFTDRKISKLLRRFKEGDREINVLSVKEKLIVKLEERKIMIKNM